MIKAFRWLHQFSNIYDYIFYIFKDIVIYVIIEINIICAYNELQKF